MKVLRYAGGSLVVGDAVAHALLDYARRLAVARTADTVVVPGPTESGGPDEAELLLGPTSQLASSAAGGPESLPGDAATLADLAARRVPVGSLVQSVVGEQDADDFPDLDFEIWSAADGA